MAFLCARGQTSGNAYQFLWFCSISAIDSSSFYMLIFNPNITDGKYTHNPSEPMHHWLRPLFSIVSSSLSSSEFMLVFRKLGNSKLYNWPLRNRRTDKKNRTARHVKWRESFIRCVMRSFSDLIEKQLSLCSWWNQRRSSPSELLLRPNVLNIAHTIASTLSVHSQFCRSQNICIRHRIIASSKSLFYQQPKIIHNEMWNANEAMPACIVTNNAEWRK